MPQPKKRILVVVADAAAARLYECTHLGGPLTLVAEKTNKVMSMPVRDRPSRVHESQGVVRHAIEPRRTPKLAAEEHFLEDVAEMVAAETFDALALCAPPKALGFLRQRLPATVIDRITLAAPKDYMREAPQDLAVRLGELAMGEG